MGKICWYIANYSRKNKAPFGGNKIEDKYLSMLVSSGYTVNRIDFDTADAKVFGNLLAANVWSLKKYYRKVGHGDIVLSSQSSYVRTLLLHVLLKLNKQYKLVMFVHHLKYRDAEGAFKKNLWRHIEKCLMKYFAAGIITISDSTKKEIEEEGANGSIIKKITPSYFTVRDNKEEKMRSGCKSNRLLYVGNCSVRKGVVYLINALKYIGHGNIELNIIGNSRVDEEYYKEMTEAVKVSGFADSIYFRGYKTGIELEEYYESSDIFVLPSEWEGLGLVILEAMSYGLPVVATFTGAIPEIIENGKDGILVEPGNSRELAGAVKKLIDDRELCSRIGANGRRKAQEWPSWEDAGAALVDLIKQLEKTG